MNIRNYAIKGVTWTAVSQFSRLGIQLLTTLILARILSPSDFGLLGMALVIIGFINVFKDLGTSSAIIQKKEISQTLLSSIFWFNVFFGIVISGIILLFAPLLADLFNEARLVPIVRVFVVSFLATTILSIQQALLEKKMDFKRLATFEIFSSLVGALIGISIALSGGGVWSLVFQTVSTSFILCTILWGQSLRWVPSFHFTMEDVKSVRSFSANLTGFTLLNYFLRNADSFIIGKFLGATELGFYNLALKTVIVPLQNITTVISRAMYPIYSMISDDNIKFRSAYLKIVTTIAFFLFPFFAFLMVVNNEFVVVLFGEKWVPTSKILFILAPIGLLQSIDTTTGSIFLAKGRTDILMKWGLFTGVLSVTAFYFGTKWGVEGVALGYLIATLIWTYHGFQIPLSLIEQRMGEFFRSFLHIALVVSVSLFVVAIFDYLILGEMGNHKILFIDFVVFVIIYFIATYFLNGRQLRELISLARSIR